jgi:hypothetical protein
MTPYLMMVLAVYIIYIVVLFAVWAWTQWPSQTAQPSPGIRASLKQTGNLSAQHVAE